MNADNTMEVFQQQFSSSQEYLSNKCDVTALEISGYSEFQKDCVLFICYGWECQREKGTEFKANKKWFLGFFFIHPLSLYSIFILEIIISVTTCFVGALGFILS